MRNTVLFLGRFQPFHLCHEMMYKKASSIFDDVLIGVGSSQYSRTHKNPWSYLERKSMIEEVISDAEIYPIDDINDPPHYVEHVEKSIPRSFDVIITGSIDTLKLFSKKYPILYMRFEGWSGTMIRQNMRNDLDDWKRHVSYSVKSVLKDAV